MPTTRGAGVETELYGPVRDFLEDQGYQVQGEVRRCDVAAVREDSLVIVELKLRLNLEVLAQAADRQAIADAVWVAIPRPRNLRVWKRRAAKALSLLQRLEIGLLLVSPRARSTPKVIVEHPVQIFDRVKDGKLRAAVMREVKARGGDFNPGGSVRKKLVSSHRETAIHIACCIERFGPLTVHQLEKLGTGPHTHSILLASEGIEGWFGPGPEGGTYALLAPARNAMKTYPDAVRHFREQLSGAAVPDGVTVHSPPDETAKPIRTRRAASKLSRRPARRKGKPAG